MKRFIVVTMIILILTPAVPAGASLVTSLDQTTDKILAHAKELCVQKSSDADIILPYCAGVRG